MAAISTIGSAADTVQVPVVPCVHRRADRHRVRPKPDRVLLAAQWIRAVIWLGIAGYGFVLSHLS